MVTRSYSEIDDNLIKMGLEKQKTVNNPPSNIVTATFLNNKNIRIISRDSNNP